MIGKNIKRLRRERGYSQEQLARKLNVTQGAVSHWEQGSSYPEAAQLLAMAQLFGVSLDTFTDESHHRELDGVVAIRKMNVPIVGEIACGTPITAQENIEGYADTPEGVHADFALRCKGDSMLPLFTDGDLVLIRQQPEVENGQIAAVGISGEATLKHVYRQKTGLLLCAANPKYAPIQTAPDDDVVIYGLAIGYCRMFE